MNQQLNGRMAIMKEKKICVEGSHEGHFFEIVLSEVMESGYLQETDIERIQIEFIEVWKKQIEAFNRGRSSSITETNAKKLLESIYCTLGFRLRVLEDLDESILLFQQKGIEALFREGQELIKERFDQLKEQYQLLKSWLLPTENRAYRDTYDEGLEPFFISYSAEFESQECPADIDYPLSNDKMEKVGIDYMVDYIEKSLLEHSLCQKFKSEEIESLLERYHKGYRELLINIFELVLMNAIGRLIIERDLDSLALGELEVEEIEKKLEILSTPLLRKLLLDKAMEVLERLDLATVEMQAYTAKTIEKYVVRIEVALEDEMLDTIFITSKKKEIQTIKYVAGKKLEDRAFKALTEEIRVCENTEDKIKWIKEQVRHIEDLRDVLEADCLFDEEYTKVYESLEDVEIALLLNTLRIDMNDVMDVEINRQWFDDLKNYLMQMPRKRQETIREVAQRMELS